VPREYCRVCDTFQSLTNDDVNRTGHYECPDCGTHLLKAKATKTAG